MKDYLERTIDKIDWGRADQEVLKALIMHTSVTLAYGFISSGVAAVLWAFAYFIVVRA